MCPPLCLWTVKVGWLGKRCSLPDPESICALSQGPLQIKLFDPGSVGSAVCSCASLPSPWAALAYWPRQLCRLHQPTPQNFHSVHLRVWKKASAPKIRTCQHWFMSKNDCILVPDESVCFCLCVSSCLNCPLPWYRTTGFILQKPSIALYVLS